MWMYLAFPGFCISFRAKCQTIGNLRRYTQSSHVILKECPWIWLAEHSKCSMIIFTLLQSIIPRQESCWYYPVACSSFRINRCGTWVDSWYKHDKPRNTIVNTFITILSKSYFKQRYTFPNAFTNILSKLCFKPRNIVLNTFMTILSKLYFKLRNTFLNTFMWCFRGSNVLWLLIRESNSNRDIIVTL